MVEGPGLFLAVAAGFVSFISPCCLPLVPGYLATVCGKSADERSANLTVVLRSLTFIAGFAAVFIALGMSATALGSLLRDNQLMLRKVAGVAIVVLGLFFIASVFVTRLNQEWRPAGLLERAGRSGPLLAGVAFAFAWTPCVGPTLGAILGLASLEQSTAQGAGLLAAYSVGLAVPFLLSAIAFGAAQRGFGWLKRHYAAIQVASGLLLVVMGVLVLTDELFRLNIEAQRALNELGLNFFQSV